MYDSPLYPVSEAEVDSFVAGQRHGTLIATPPGGHPQVSILPFLRDGGIIAESRDRCRPHRAVKPSGHTAEAHRVSRWQ